MRFPLLLDGFGCQSFAIIIMYPCIHDIERPTHYPLVCMHACYESHNSSPCHKVCCIVIAKSVFILCSECYFTNDSINNNKREFMKVINSSYRIGCLQCSFTDKELNEYIQIKKRKSNFIKKNAVQTVGKQGDNTWVLGPDSYISSTGNSMSTADSSYIWVGNLYSGLGIPANSQSCDIHLPLSTNPLKPLLEALHSRLGHNFFPALLLMGSAAWVLHYQQFIKKLRYCPIPVAFGESGTGKTTALESAMSLLGAQSRVYCKVTREKIYDMCCKSGGIPVGVDDPHSKTDINKLLVDLYNGKRGGSMGHGDHLQQ